MTAGGSPVSSCATCQAALRPGSAFCLQCGTAVQEDGVARDPLIGMVLAQKFRVMSVLGEGGMGKVYKAEQVPLGIDVVIKVLHPQLANDTMVVKRFFREAQAASRLRHPNCVGILDFGESDGTLYIAMEFLRGRTLSTVISEGVFAPKRAVRVIGQVLDVLEAAHRMEIVHRDLKPDNIMVEDLATHRDFIKVLDFGIAKIADRDGGTKLTQTGMIFGTPQYMAPEQATGDPIDGRTDLYAVGSILFELLTGQVPFRATSIAMLLADVVGKPAPPIGTLRPDLPAKLQAIVDSALQKDPAQRPQRALDMKESLEACIAELEPNLRDSVPGSMRACPSCGFPQPITAKFCGECGASTALAAVTQVGDKLADLRRFLPTGVVDELAQMRPRVAGEKREIVVAVVDVGGAALEGDEAERIQGELYAGLQAIAARRGGSLERRTGSGAIVTFGLYALHADDAERAVAAALEVRDLAKKLGIEATTAIHGGQAMVEQSGSYSPVGDAVELPTRLAATVAAGKIVISERLRPLLRDHVAVRAMEAVRLKGRAAAVPIYEVAAMHARIDRHDALARPPTVGREQLIAAIMRAAEDAKRGRTIHLVGEPGLGKTRIADELAERWQSKQHLVLALAPHARGSRIEPSIARIATAFGGSLDGFRALGITGGDARALLRYVEGGGVEGLGEMEERMALVAALRTGLERLATRVPVVVLVDDVHQAEPITAMLVARVATEPLAGVTLVTTTRPGYSMPWDAARAAAAGLQAVAIATLPDDAIAELVAGALAPTPPPAALVAAVTKRAAGSPLMALEVLRAMIDHGLLSSAGGRWTVVGDLGQLPRLDGVRALYAARIDALPQRAREVLACLAVYGDDMPAELAKRVVAKIAADSAQPIDREIEQLIARGLVVNNESRLRFAEPSAREAVYERLAKETRAKIHLAVAAGLEAMLPPRPVVDEAIAEHYAQGGDAPKALTWLERAASSALAVRQRQRAAQILKKSRELAKTGERTAARNRRTAEDSLRLGELLLELGDLAPIKQIASEGLAAAHADDDPDLIARMRRLRGRALSASGDLDAALADLEAALTGALTAKNKVLIAEVHGDLGEAYEKKGELARALEYMSSALELAQGSAQTEVRRIALRLLTSIGRVCVRKQELDRAQRFLQQGLELAQQLDDHLGAAKVLGNLAGVYHARGDFTTAIRFVRRALDMSRDLGDLVGVTRQLNNLGTLYAALGDTAQARTHYDSAFASAQKCGWREGMAAAAAARDRLR